jgi:hypothetical protein
MITTYYFRALLGDSTSTRGQDSHTPFFSKTIGKKISINLVYIFIVINASLYTKQSKAQATYEVFHINIFSPIKIIEVQWIIYSFLLVLSLLMQIFR